MSRDAIDFYMANHELVTKLVSAAPFRPPNFIRINDPIGPLPIGLGLKR